MRNLALTLMLVACGSDDEATGATPIACDAMTTIVEDACSIRTGDGAVPGPFDEGAAFAVNLDINDCTAASGIMTCAKSEVANGRRGVVVLMMDGTCEMRECE